MNAELIVDWTRCEGRGVCLDLLPGSLRPDDWGYPLAPHPGVRILIDGDSYEAATTAVRECPRLALRLATPS